MKNIYRTILPTTLRKSISICKQIIKDKVIDCLAYCFAFEQYPYRKYYDKHKCIFIHIPKNAGTSVIQLLAGDTMITGRRIDDSMIGIVDKFYHQDIDLFQYTFRGTTK